GVVLQDAQRNDEWTYPMIFKHVEKRRTHQVMEQIELQLLQEEATLKKLRSLSLVLT
ncbi:unnamed protein product, partial [Amoebophrya sp. A25]